MSTLPKSYITPEQYLEIDRQADRKSEYCDGEMFAMAGAKESHNLIVANLITTLNSQLRETPCRVYPSDLRVRVSASGIYTYPDLSIVCEEPRFLDGSRDTLLNPTVVFEVLSESTERYDLGRKFDHYDTLDSLREYVLVASDRISVEVFSRQRDLRWLLAKSLRVDDTTTLESIGCALALADVYTKVRFPPPEPRA